eukprot:6465906-Amphidinium_carterae.1
MPTLDMEKIVRHILTLKEEPAERGLETYDMSETLGEATRWGQESELRSACRQNTLPEQTQCLCPAQGMLDQ